MHQVHHSDSLEYAHLKPAADPNRLANLWGLPEEAHQLASNEWTAFRNALRGREPSQAEVMAMKMKIDRMVAPYSTPRPSATWPDPKIGSSMHIDVAAAAHQLSKRAHCVGIARTTPIALFRRSASNSAKSSRPTLQRSIVKTFRGWASSTRLRRSRTTGSVGGTPPSKPRALCRPRLSRYSWTAVAACTAWISRAEPPRLQSISSTTKMVSHDHDGRLARPLAPSFSYSVRASERKGRNGPRGGS